MANPHIKENKDQFIERNLKLVHHICHKFERSIADSHYDYDDLFSAGQFALVKAYNTFNPTRGAKWSTYAGMIITNEIRILLRKVRKTASTISLHTEIDGNNGDKLELGDTIPCTEEVNEDGAFAEEFLRLLPERERNLVVMLAEGYTQAEIAKEEGISQSYTARILSKVNRQATKYLECGTKPKYKGEPDMSKLSDKHIAVIMDWMREHPNERPPVSKLWRENGLENLNGYQTIAKKKAAELLGTKAEIRPIKPTTKAEPESRLTEVEKRQVREAMKKIKEATNTPEKHTESIPNQLAYTADLTPESVQSIAKSLQGMAYTSQLMKKKAKVIISVEVG